MGVLSLSVALIRKVVGFTLINARENAGDITGDEAMGECNIHIFQLVREIGAIPKVVLGVADKGRQDAAQFLGQAAEDGVTG